MDYCAVEHRPFSFHGGFEVPPLPDEKDLESTGSSEKDSVQSEDLTCEVKEQSELIRVKTLLNAQKEHHIHRDHRKYMLTKNGRTSFVYLAKSTTGCDICVEEKDYWGFYAINMLTLQC